VHQRVDGGAGKGLIGQSSQQIGDQAHLVGNDVVGYQTQLRLAAGQNAVLLVLHDGHGDVGALGAGAAGGGDGNDILLMLHGEALEIQVVHRIRALAAQQLAQIQNRAAAHRDHAVIAVIGDGVVHGLDHGLGGLPGAELLLEHELALQVQFLHIRCVDKLVGQNHVPLIQIEFLGQGAEILELVNGRCNNDLPLVRHQRSRKCIHVLFSFSL